MAREKESPLHWITFCGSRPFETLNPLWLCLSNGGMELETVSVFLGPKEREKNEQLLARLEALLKMCSETASMEVVECDPASPEAFAEALAGLLASARGRGERVILDLSASQPSHVAALSAQIAERDPEVLLLVLNHERPSFREIPFALIPRSGHQLFQLKGGKPQPWKLPERAAPSPSPDTMRNTWHLACRELMLLVNGFLDLGYDRNVSLRLPLLKDLPLCRLHFGGDEVTVTDFIQQKDYKKRLQQLSRSLSAHARRQLPAYNQLVQILYASGVYELSGVSRLIEELEALGSRPLDEGGDVYHIALDTNLLRDRFFSTCLSGLSLPPNIDYVLCETVRTELLNRQDKIDEGFLDTMAPLVRDLAGELFFNQNQLEDRLRYVGLLEFNRMRALTGCHEQDAGSARSSSRNDRYILEAYSGFVDVGCKVLFLSRDQETIRMMRGEEGVLTLLLEQDESPGESFGIDWKAFPDWLYLLAVAYGRMEWVVGGAPMASVDGVWAGKTVDQWEEDHARLKLIRPRSSHDVEDYLRLCRGIREDYAGLRKLGEV